MTEFAFPGAAKAFRARGRSFASPIKMNERPVTGTAKMSTNGTSRTYPPGT
jgi:predicted PhzF superfamily epimerase YddE/YHI9